MSVNGFIRRMVGVLFKPTETFREIGKTKPVGQALIIFVVVPLFLQLLSMILIQSNPDRLDILKNNIHWVFIYAISGLILDAILFGITHLIARYLFKGKENFVATFCVLSFALVPVYLLSLLKTPLMLPLGEEHRIIAGLFILLLHTAYNIILSIIGISVVHNISKLKAVISLLPLISCHLLATIGAVLSIMMLKAGMFEAGLVTSPLRGQNESMTLPITLMEEVRIQEACASNKTIDEVDRCLNTMAMGYHNYSLCYKMSTQEKAENCVFEYAFNLRDPGACAALKITKRRDNCYMNVALNTKNKSLCEKIGGSQTKAICRGANITDAIDEYDPLEECMLKETSMKDHCLSWAALQKNDSSICDKIINKSLRDTCFQNIFKRIRDINLCLKKSNPDPCIQSYAEDTKNATLCSLMNDPDYCYINIMMNTQDGTLCQEVKNISLMKTCARISTRFKPVPKNATLCSREEDPDQCHITMMILTEDVDLCQEVKNTRLRETCFSAATRFNS